MAHPLTGPLVAYASRLRFPTLFKISIGLFVLSWLLPDPIPFLDEIATAVAALALGAWKQPAPPEAPSRPAVTLEGESRRE